MEYVHVCFLRIKCNGICTSPLVQRLLALFQILENVLQISIARKSVVAVQIVSENDFFKTHALYSFPGVAEMNIPERRAPNSALKYRVGQIP